VFLCPSYPRGTGVVGVDRCMDRGVQHTAWVVAVLSRMICCRCVAGGEVQVARVFVSHASEDLALACEVYQWLRSRPVPPRRFS